MNTIKAQPTSSGAADIAKGVSLGALWLAWNSVRLPTLALLTVLEPFVTGILAALAILGVFAAFFLEYLARLPQSRFWLLISFAAGCALLLLLYHAAIRILSSR